MARDLIEAIGRFSFTIMSVRLFPFADMVRKS
jgi:hypothetical protein